MGNCGSALSYHRKTWVSTSSLMIPRTLQGYDRAADGQSQAVRRSFRRTAQTGAGRWQEPAPAVLLQQRVHHSQQGTILRPQRDEGRPQGRAGYLAHRSCSSHDYSSIAQHGASYVIRYPRIRLENLSPASRRRSGPVLHRQLGPQLCRSRRRRTMIFHSGSSSSRGLRGWIREMRSPLRKYTVPARICKAASAESRERTRCRPGLKRR